MPELRPRGLPTAHRISRVLVLAVLAITAVLAGGSGPVDRAARAVLRGEEHFTGFIWNPLLHGGGWVAPLLPEPTPSPTRPRVSPSPPAVPKPHPTRKPTHRPTRRR